MVVTDLVVRLHAEPVGNLVVLARLARKLLLDEERLVGGLRSIERTASKCDIVGFRSVGHVLTFAGAHKSGSAVGRESTVAYHREGWQECDRATEEHDQANVGVCVGGVLTVFSFSRRSLSASNNCGGCRRRSARNTHYSTGEAYISVV